MRIILVGAVSVALLLSGCKNSIRIDAIKLTVCIDYAYHQKIYLQRVPFNEEKVLVLDSAVVQTGRDTLNFYLPAGNQQRLYNVTVAESDINIPVIADTKSIILHYNYSTKRYWYTNSPASQALKNFNDTQLVLATRMSLLKKSIDSMAALHVPEKHLRDSMANLNGIFFERYKNFADTVNNPAAFLAVYDLVDFGNNKKALRKFINGAGTRFAGDTTLQKFRAGVIAYVDALENQYKIGDTLPDLVLPDEYGAAFSTYSLKGKWVFVNIWATFCEQCSIFAESIRKAKQQYGNNKFEAVGIAVDDEQEQWHNIITKNNYNWPQLIDVKMWQGPAFKTFRFDSIPYNFLLSPTGKLMAKAIPADSVMIVISKFVK